MKQEISQVKDEMKLEISKNNQLVQDKLDQNSAEISKITAPFKEEIKAVN